MDEKTIQRIKKLQALAERGVGGEKTTAQKKLAKLLKDNGINSLDELQKEEYEYTIFSYNGKHEIKLLRQCMYKVMGTKSDRTAYYKKYAAGNGTKYYRVRKSWTDAASQLGAFTSLENAKSACKAGYTVYDDNGKAVYTAAGQQASVGVPFSVQVDILDLNIRTGAGTNYAKTGETTGKGVFTIVEVKAGQGASVGWGRLKSGAGWISLDYATRLA